MKKITGQMVCEARHLAAQEMDTADYYDSRLYDKYIADRLNAELRAQHNANVDQGFWRATAAAGVICFIGTALALLNGDMGVAAAGGVALAILILVAYRVA